MISGATTPFITLALMLFAAAAQPAPAKPAPDTAGLSCMTGPAKRTFGGHPWLVYSCDDQQTIVIITEAGNPAAPFYFLIYKQDGAYQIGGEGNGDRTASAAARDDIARLTPADIDRLLRETKSPSARP